MRKATAVVALVLGVVLGAGMARGEDAKEKATEAKVTEAKEKAAAAAEAKAKAAVEAKEKVATAVAEAWLKLIDEGKYGESWKQATGLFKGAVTKEQWEQMASGVRALFGKLLTRKVKGAKYTTSAPGAPEGEYVIIQFDSSFTEKPVAIETVTPMLDKDGKWHVSGYFIN